MRPVDIPSLMDIRFPSQPAISPDGRRTAFVVAKASRGKDRYISDIRVIDHETGAARRVTSTGRVEGFAWEDADTLLFPARRGKADRPKKGEEKTVYYRMRPDGSDLRRAFEIPLSVSDLRPLGGGRYLALARADLNAPKGGADDPARGEGVRVLEEVPFWANGDGYVSRIRSALFLFDSARGQCKKLTDDYMDVASFDVRGDRVAWAGCRYTDVVSRFDEAWVYDIAAERATRIVEGGRYQISRVLLTEHSAVLAMTTGEEWGLEQMPDWYRCDLRTGALTLAAHMEYCLGSAAALDCCYGGGKSAVALGESVVFIAQRGCRSQIFRLNADDSLQCLVPFEGNALWLDAKGDRLVFGAHAENGLGELYGLEGGAVRKLTDLNGRFLRTHAVAKAEYTPFTGRQGTCIDGWVLRPADFDPAKRYPGVLQIHGGPRGAYGAAMFHEMQALCAAGYVVFFCNPRGSEGYGEAFADLRGKYGTVDYEDLMDFTDHVLSAVPQLDPRRLGACGGSYGGFMCNWIEGHTRRFAAIVSQRSISDWVSDFGTSQIGLTFDKNEIGGDPWSAPEAFWAQSPLKYAAAAATPILLIHSACDYNCTLGQGMEMFSAMKYFGVPARMVVFEGENHSLSRSGKPRHRIRRLEEILGWFEKYLKEEE